MGHLKGSVAVCVCWLRLIKGLRNDKKVCFLRGDRAEFLGNNLLIIQKQWHLIGVVDGVKSEYKNSSHELEFNHKRSRGVLFICIFIYLCKKALRLVTCNDDTSETVLLVLFLLLWLLSSGLLGSWMEVN